jgi:hypothetical protein
MKINVTNVGYHSS